MKATTLVATLLVSVALGGQAMAYETRDYDVIESDGDFEVREYGSIIVAETTVAGEFDQVGSEAFRILFAYISGENETGDSVAMTTPVTQEASQGSYRVTFMMPSTYTLETLPEPGDERVLLREEPANRFASVRYSGFWSQGRYDKNLQELRRWINERGMEATGEPVWARYDPPFMPWFLRTNEILIPVKE
jgi:hypothetical protein